LTVQLRQVAKSDRIDKNLKKLNRSAIQMIIEYCHKAIGKAEYRKLEDGTWFAEIPGFKGVWANGESVEECRKELIDVLEEWLVLKLRDKDPIPTVDGLTIEIRDVAAA
jgi:predicted RNase H-like HicB family nuclease